MGPNEWADLYRQRSEQALGGVRPHFAGELAGLFMAVKGVPGAAERAGGQIMSGDDGEALRKSLGRLGFDESQVCYCLVELADGSRMAPADLRRAVETVDPIVVVTLDAAARQAFCEAFGLSQPPAFGEKVRVRGYIYVAVEDFEEALATQEGKRAAWAQLKAAARPGEPY